jgi:hypothetical protein
MSRQHEKRILRHFHRGLIAGLSLFGMLLDGPQLSDLFLQGAALIWLWAKELQSLESACLQRLYRRDAVAAHFLSGQSTRRDFAGIRTQPGKGEARCG